MENDPGLLSRGIFSLVDFILHIDKHLDALVAAYGWQTHLILFLIVFWETGVVICPFLPGDSLLFAAGAIASRAGSPLSLPTLLLLVALAAFLGDTLNYWVGRWLGPAVLKRDGKILKKKYLDKTRDFYDRYGAKTIVLARFVPIVRTFAPFVAGVGAMRYPKFLFYNLAGGILWTVLLTCAGYLFAGLPLVRDNFTAVILVIILISVLPMVVEYLRARRKSAESRKTSLRDPSAGTLSDQDPSALNAPAPESPRGPEGA
ncbi:MAG: DedA family protein [Deltaproteobacteria bacterium]|jgi:membrane-associated protein|nr:DedA family protein [Deltaproteobacteria bacterium]